METTIKINNANKDRDYFPSLFTNKDNTVLILADSRVSDKTFSGMVIHSKNNTKTTLIGTYSSGWTYAQFKRLPKGSTVDIQIKQED